MKLNMGVKVVRKKVLSALLVLVLFLSIAPISAYASTFIPITITQQTTGEFANVEKEFVYYIPLTNGVTTEQLVKIDTTFTANVEIIEQKITVCNCGVNFISIDPDYEAKWTEHRGSPRDPNSHFTYPSTIYTEQVYKITLKNGEKVELKVKDSTRISIDAIREDNYTMSYLRGGKETPVSQSASLTGFSLLFPTANETIIMKRTNGNEDVTTSTNPYTDVNITDWYWPAVKYMSEHKYMVGYSDTEFSPNDTLSRAMFVTVLYRVSGEKVDAKETKFTDVPQNTWYTEAVAWALANGVTSGTSDTTFSPDEPVSREQMSTFIERYAKSKGIDLGAKYITGEPDDLYTGNDWGRSGLLYAYEYGLLFTTDGKAYPTNNATRADAVVAFHNFLCRDSLVTCNSETCNHNWATRHIDEVGHWEDGEDVWTPWTFQCICGFSFEADDKYDRDALDKINAHLIENHHGRFWTFRESTSKTTYIVDVPAHDEVFCTLCGLVQ